MSAPPGRYQGQYRIMRQEQMPKTYYAVLPKIQRQELPEPLGTGAAVDVRKPQTCEQHGVGGIEHIGKTVAAGKGEDAELQGNAKYLRNGDDEQN